MYQHQGLNDVFFLMLYGAAAMFALVACCYLLFRRVNVIADSVASPVGLRRWAAAFLAAVAASHVWWALLGTVWLADDRLVRNLVGILLDRLTFVPLIMVVLVRMLQDRRRSLWPILLAMVPVAAIIGAGLVTHDADTETYNRYYTLVLIVSFVVYMIFAVRRYSLWLRDNYADLEHKEVWQSLLGLLCLILAFATYIVNLGSQFMEYLVQVETLFIVGFLTWRVDTIQQLSVGDEEFGPVRSAAGSQGLTSGGKDDAFIRSRLQEYCETTQLYLQHGSAQPGCRRRPRRPQPLLWPAGIYLQCLYQPSAHRPFCPSLPRGRRLPASRYRPAAGLPVRLQQLQHLRRRLQAVHGTDGNVVDEQCPVTYI